MAKKEEKKRTFESESLVLPPLKMALTESDRPDLSARQQQVKEPGNPARQQAVLRLIEKLVSKE